MHVHAAPSSPGANRTKTVLRFSLVATLAYVVITFIAGLRAHSLALLSEAGHNASDFLALLLSFAAVYFQTRPTTHSKTFGYQRAGVLAAFINAASLIVISLWIAIEAVHRLSAPVAVQPKLMMIVAAAGVLMNGVIAALLWGVARDVNMRSAFLHMAGDTLSTAAVIAGGARPSDWFCGERSGGSDQQPQCAQPGADGGRGPDRENRKSEGGIAVKSLVPREKRRF